MNDDEESRQFVRDLFKDPPPRDIVAGPGLTREDLERMNAATGKPGTGTVPGQITFDVDGVPNGVEESRSISSIFGGACISEADAERLGFTADEFPNIRILGEDGRPT